MKLNICNVVLNLCVSVVVNSVVLFLASVVSTVELSRDCVVLTGNIVLNSVAF